MSSTRDPMPGELKLVVIVGAVQFHAFQPVAVLDDLMDALERRLRDGERMRSDRLAQMSLRQWVAEQIGNADVEQAQATFNDIGGAACIWLGLRHYEASNHLRQSVDRHAGEGMVLTVAVGDSPQSAPGTAWSFILGRSIHDGRAMLADQPSDRIAIYGTDVT